MVMRSSAAHLIVEYTSECSTLTPSNVSGKTRAGRPVDWTAGQDLDSTSVVWAAVLPVITLGQSTRNPNGLSPLLVSRLTHGVCHDHDSRTRDVQLCGVLHQLCGGASSGRERTNGRWANWRTHSAGAHPSSGTTHARQRNDNDSPLTRMGARRRGSLRASSCIIRPR